MDILKAEEKRSYPELEGKEMEFISSYWNEGDAVLIRIVGCDYAIGVTAVNAADPKDYFLCMHGRLSPKNKDRPYNKDNITRYDTMFKFFLEAVAKGKYDAAGLYQLITPGSTAQPSAKSCSFGQ